MLACGIAMARSKRALPAGCAVHAINRGNDRRRLFSSPRDYDEFLDILDLARRRTPVRLIAYVVMPNHWHLLIWPTSSSELSQFMHYLTARHAVRFRMSSQTLGLGHVYQGRYRCHPIDTERRFVRTARYIEANPLRAGLVRRAGDWRWSSLYERLTGIERIVEGPVALPPADAWNAIVNSEAEEPLDD